MGGGVAGPGRELLVDGWRAWRRGAPDMSTLVGLGASASFGVSCIAAGLPALGWKTFFEEPAMLLGFVLVGRALEERAKLQASADMAALQVPLPCAEFGGRNVNTIHSPCFAMYFAWFTEEICSVLIVCSQ